MYPVSVVTYRDIALLNHIADSGATTSGTVHQCVSSTTALPTKKYALLLSRQPVDDSPQPPSHPPIVPNSSISFPSQSPTTVKYVRALILPADRRGSYHTTIQLYGDLSPTGRMRWTPQLGNVLEGSTFPYSVVSTKGVGGKPLHFPLKVIFDISPSSTNQASIAPTNECVQALTCEARHIWRGNILIIGFNGPRRDAYRDIEDSDWSSIMYFLVHYGSVT